MEVIQGLHQSPVLYCMAKSAEPRNYYLELVDGE